MRLLAESQAEFASALLNPEKPAPGDIRRPSLSEAGRAQTKRFDVYRNNVLATAIDALAETFPVVEKLVGEAFFRAMAKSFVIACPPRSPILMDIGEGFAAFIDDFPPAQSVPYLADMARLEQARVRGHHATDAVPIDISQLAVLEADIVGNVTLQAHPSLTLIRSAFPIGSVWSVSIGESDDSADIDMSQGEDVLILRPSLKVETIVLPAGGGAFLAALLDGQSIAAAAEAGSIDSEYFDLSSHLAGTFAAGAFSGLDPYAAAS